MSIPSVPPIPGIPTPTLLTYADLVTVNMDETNDVNIADTGDYGHRVQVTLGKTLFNLFFRWHRDVGQDRPHAKLSTSDIIENTFKSVLIESLNSSYMDIDGVTGGLHFSTANMSLNRDPRLRKNGLVSANDIPMAFVMYRLYGNSAFQTKDYIFNLNDAHDMLTSETVADAIIASFKQHETGALDKMFRDLLSQDPRRFFDENGHQEPNLFETATDLAGAGSWKLIENDIVEIKTKLIFHSNITKRGVAGREHLLSDVNEAENQQKIIVPDDYFYVRLQLKIVDDGTIVDPTNLIYSDSTKTVVTGYTGPITGELIIPEGATSIATGAFKNQAGLTSVLFPQSLTSIGTEAFMNTGLVEVFLPNVTTIGASSFKNSTALSTVLAPNLTTIGANAFEGCIALESFNGSSTIVPTGARAIGDIPGIIETQPIINLTNLTSIGASTFAGCTSIQEVTIPITVTSLPTGIFSGCSNITSITIPTSVTSLGASAFASTGLTSVTLHSGITVFGASVFSGCEDLTAVTLLGSILTLPSAMFLNCSSLTSVTLPSSLLTIAAQSLKNTRIVSLTFPNVTTIGAAAFAQNPALVSIIAPSVQSVATDAFVGASNVTNVPADVSSLTFSDGTNTTVTGYTGSFGVLTFPSTATAIAASAFLNNANVIGATIPSTLQSIGANAFKGSGLKSIALPSTLSSIGNNAFQTCLSLTSITFPGANITSLGSYLFAGCTALTSVTVPSGMTSIPASCFNGCLALSSVTLHDGVSSIGSYAFSACTGLTSFTFPSSLTTLSSYTFNGCTGLTSLTLPNTLMNYQAGAFYGCTGLTSIAFPSATTTLIGDQVLAGCTGLTSVTFPNKGSGGLFPLTLGTSVLLGCSGLTSFTIPNQWPALPNGFFENCSGLTTIAVPSTITSMGTGVFKGCSGLTSATVNAPITTLPVSTFINCTSLASVLLASSITTIDGQALRNTRLTSFVNFAVKTINALAFADNPTISSTNIPNLDTLDTTAFNNTPALLEKPQALVRSGAGSVPVDASGNMVEFGYNMTPSYTDDSVTQIPARELQGFTFNINGTNYGTSIYASTNLSITFGSGATVASSFTYALISTQIGFGLAAADRRSNRICYFRSTLSDFDILTFQYWFEDYYTGITGNTGSANSYAPGNAYPSSAGQYQVRLIKQLSNGKQWVETRIVKGPGIVNYPGQWAIATGTALTDASSTIYVSAATTFATPATILYSSDSTGTTWAIQKNNYLNINNNNSVVNTTTLIASVVAPLVSGAGTVPLTSGNMTPAGYGILTSPIDDSIVQVPTAELAGFIFNMNGVNYGVNIFASTNLNITLGSAATLNTYSLGSIHRGFSFNGFNSKANRINFFRSSVTDYEILTLQYWFENTNTGGSGAADFNLSDGQLQVRLIKQISTGIQFVETRVVKGTSSTPQGQWAIASTPLCIEASSYITTTPVTTFLTPATIVYVSDASGVNWQVVKGAYVNVNNDNAVVNPLLSVATVEAPLVSGTGTVPLTSGNMTRMGAPVMTWVNTAKVNRIPAADLTGFVFNMNGTNYGTSIHVSNNLGLSFGSAMSTSLYTLVSTNIGVGFGMRNTRTNRINYFRSSLANYEILTIQYWFENTTSATTGAVDFTLSPGQVQVRLIKEILTGKQLIEIRIVKGSGITTLGQFAVATGTALVDANIILGLTAANTYTIPATIVFVSDSTGTSWKFARDCYVNTNNDNSVLTVSSVIPAELVAGTGVVAKDASGNMSLFGTNLMSFASDDTLYTIPANAASGTLGFTFNINNVNHGGTMNPTTNMIVGLGTSNGITHTTYTTLSTTQRGFGLGSFDSKSNQIAYLRTTTANYDILSIQWYNETTTGGSTGTFTNPTPACCQMRVRFIKKLTGTQTQFVEICFVKGSSTTNVTYAGNYHFAPGGSVSSVNMNTLLGTLFVNTNIRSQNTAITYVSDPNGTTASWTPYYNYIVNV